MLRLAAEVVHYCMRVCVCVYISEGFVCEKLLLLLLLYNSILVSVRRLGVVLAGAVNRLLVGFINLPSPP